MVLQPDQERVRALLTDTITLMCKNGLKYKTEFCISGVIGITLDKCDVFLVDIRETIKSDTPENETDKSGKSETPSPVEFLAQSNKRMKKDSAKSTKRQCIGDKQGNLSVSSGLDMLEIPENQFAEELMGIVKSENLENDSGYDCMLIKQEPGVASTISCSETLPRISEPLLTVPTLPSRAPFYGSSQQMAAPHSPLIGSPVPRVAQQV